jgi:hypothetical protein
MVVQIQFRVYSLSKYVRGPAEQCVSTLSEKGLGVGSGKLLYGGRNTTEVQ